MNVVDRVRVERAVSSYRWWLDVRGASLRRRRELGSELRGNLLEAAEQLGARQAVQALGSPRQMAADAVPVRRGRPRWTLGARTAGAAMAAVVLVEFLAALAWLDGVADAGPTHRVSGSLTLFPGSSLRYDPFDTGFSMLFEPGWLCLPIALVVFLAVCRPWLALGRRSTAHAPDDIGVA